MLNLAYALNEAPFLDERRLIYTPMAIDFVNEDNLSQSIAYEPYLQSESDDPHYIFVTCHCLNMLLFEKYDSFITECEKYYPQLSYKAQVSFGIAITETYSETKNIKYAECLILAYSKMAENTDDEAFKGQLISNIVSTYDNLKHTDENFSLDNEYLRSMTVDGEHIPITVNGKTVHYFSISKADYVETIDDIRNSSCSKSDFDVLQVNVSSLDDVQKIDKQGNYTFLYTGRNDCPKCSKHYTDDGYLITVTYSEDNIINEITCELL